MLGSGPLPAVVTAAGVVDDAATEPGNGVVLGIAAACGGAGLALLFLLAIEGGPVALELAVDLKSARS